MADDSAFGPHLAHAFDFTIVFEQSILSILPSALFLSASVVRLYALAGRPVKVKSGALLLGKLVRTNFCSSQPLMKLSYNRPLPCLLESVRDCTKIGIRQSRPRFFVYKSPALVYGRHSQSLTVDSL